MSRLDDHPTVRAVRERGPGPAAPTGPLDAAWLRALCLEHGADDVGFVEIGRAEIADQRADIEAALPGARTLISIVCRTNVAAIRTPARSAGNVELHHTIDTLDEVGHDVCRALQERGCPGAEPRRGFPMEMGNWPGKVWVVSHKPGGGRGGPGEDGHPPQRHPPPLRQLRLLGTLIIEAEVDHYDRPIDFNPCLECKLCVTACPTGAISKTGEFNFSSCITHNYREFMTGFGDWVEDIAAASGPRGLPGERD